jgi:hypothetical protein
MAEAGEDNPRTGCEASDMDVKTVGLAALAIAVWLVVVPIILALGYPDATRDAAKAPTLRPPEPRLQTDPERDLRLYNAAKQARLTSYGWVDRTHGVVHIPIDEAMRRLAARGIAGWPGGATPAGKSAEAR